MRHDTWGFAEGSPIGEGRTAVRRLGGGVRFEAWLAWDETLFAPVVAKVLRPSQLDSRRARRALAREADAATQLAHPSLVRAFGADLDGAHPHLVLEYVEGPRLSSLLRRHGPLPLEQVLPLGLELCSVLHYLAARAVVHLDVKPANIVMSAPPRLIDLSLARSHGAAAELGEAIGTDAYMPPEQCLPAEFGPVGAPADVWSLGATLFEAIAGYRPFADAQAPPAHPQWPQLAADRAPLPRFTPPALAAAVQSCLEFDPRARPTPAELAGSLEPLVAALPAPVLAGFLPSPREKRARTLRRNRG
ncbi:MAG: serine/threonine-protein kinase [Sporichthyaceae bacterium]